jgi:hypothetical protein
MFSSKRSYLLPKGCKDLADVLAAKAKRAMSRKRAPLETSEQIRDVVKRYVQELTDGSLEIVATVRIVGRRCLLVVRPREQVLNRDGWVEGYITVPPREGIGHS